MDRAAWQAAVHGVTKSRTELGDRARVHTQPAQPAHTAKGHTRRTEGSDEKHTKKPTVKSEHWWSFSGENCTPKIKIIRPPTWTLSSGRAWKQCATKSRIVWICMIGQEQTRKGNEENRSAGESSSPQTSLEPTSHPWWQISLAIDSISGNC